MPCGRQHLKLVRLPISPPPLEVNSTSIPKNERPKKGCPRDADWLISTAEVFVTSALTC
jgi:hypothetical protein